MNITLLANENFPVPAIRKLRVAGVDVVAVIETMRSASDQVVMAYARREQRWIVTFDRDYGDLIFREGLLPPPAILFSGRRLIRSSSLPILCWHCCLNRSGWKAAWW
jgi:predicted nuclease of predicted toxin-antitoxin system